MVEAPISQQELFLLVWESPSQDVARSLGISVVALGKLCKKLRVPKPPSGYWAKIESGKLPQKSIVKQICGDGIAEKSAATNSRRIEVGISLTDLQSDFLYRATSELAHLGIDITGLEFSKNGIRSIDQDLCSQVIVYIQRNHNKWLTERTDNGRPNSSTFRSINSLVAKLLPLSKKAILILERQEGNRKGDISTPKIIIRCSATFQQQVANMCHLVRQNRLSVAAWDLAALEHAWTVQYYSHYPDYIRAKSQLYVSSTHVWVQCTLARDWGDEVFDTGKIEVTSVAPVDVLPLSETQLPKCVEADKLRIPRQQIESFERSSQALDTVSSAVLRSERVAPDDYLVLIERLWRQEGQDRPLRSYRKILEEIERDLERLEQELELEGEEMCRNALGVNIGDTVLANLRNQSVRIKIEALSTHIADNKIYFYLNGRRYRKDGVLGKRQEGLYITTNLRK